MTDSPAPPEDVRRAADRPTSEHPTGVRATHSFSFGAHYDPANLGFGPMLCHDEHRLPPGQGYDDHPHSEVEIVTWVLDGSLVHASPTSPTTELGPGGVQVLSAGSGVLHSETGDPAAGTTRFVQTWLRPDEPGRAPSYAAGPEPVVTGGGLVPVAGGGTWLGVGVRGATLWTATPATDGTLSLPEAPLLHVFLAAGTGTLEHGGHGTQDDVSLSTGDAVRLVASGGRRLALGAGAQLLVWSFDRP